MNPWSFWFFVRVADVRASGSGGFTHRWYFNNGGLELCRCPYCALAGPGDGK